MADTKYGIEGWAPSTFDDLNVLDHVRWTPAKKYRTDRPQPIVGVVTGVESTEKYGIIDVRVSGARTIILTVRPAGLIGMDRYVSWAEVGR